MRSPCWPAVTSWWSATYPLHPGFQNLVGIDSPSGTASLALARHVADALSS
jgi:hypothetical protein